MDSNYVGGYTGFTGTLTAGTHTAFNEATGGEAYGLWIERVGADAGKVAAMNINNIVATGTDFEAGARFNHMTDGTVDIGKITVRDGETAGAGVSGLYVRDSAMDGNIAITEIDAVGSRYATGVELKAGMAGGNLSVGTIVATATNEGREGDDMTEAHGIFVKGDAAGKITAGRITATADSSDLGGAYGVKVLGNADDLVLKGDITADGTAYAYGVLVDGNANITLGNNVNISATGTNSAAIQTAGTLDIDLNGKVLTTDD
jgi:hypothetical protein